MAPVADKKKTKSPRAQKKKERAEDVYQKRKRNFAAKKRSKNTRGRSLYWFKLIHQKLMTYRREPQHGFWDPRTHNKTDKALAKFYKDENSVCQYAGSGLEHREYTAGCLIRQVLAKYEGTESVVVSNGFRSSTDSATTKEEQELVTSIHHGAMQDDGRDLELAEGNDKIKVISQTLISASPNCLGPPLKPCIKYLRLIAVEDRGKGLTRWRTPFLPCLNGKEGNKALLDNQVTAIVWILSRYGKLPRLKSPRSGLLPNEALKDQQNRERLSGPAYRGGILADCMGLGKSLCTVASLAIIASQGINVSISDGGTKLYSPMLLLVPAGVVKQWVEDFLLSTDKQAFSCIITSGTGLEKTLSPESFAAAEDPRLKVLPSKEFTSLLNGNSPIWDRKDPAASHTILIVPIDTWAGRTVYTHNGETKFYQNNLATAARRYSVVAVDEAHKLKNQATRLWYSVDMLERDFTLLITATPSINSLVDLFALGALLRKAPENYVNQNPGCVDGGLQCLERLEGLKTSDPLYLIAGHLPLLGKLTNNGRQVGFKTDIQTIRSYLQYFERLAILQRAPTSKINLDWDGKHTLSLQGLFPDSQHSTVLIESHSNFANKYQRIHYKLLLDYLKALRMMYADEEGNMKRRKPKGAEKPKLATKTPRKRRTKSSQSVGFKAEQPQDDGVKDTTIGIETEVQVILNMLIDTVAAEYGSVMDQDIPDEPNEEDDEFLKEENFEGDSHLTRVTRNLTIAAASLDVLRLQHVFLKNDFNTRADTLALMRRNGVTFIDIVPFLIDKGRKRKDMPKNAFEYLAIAVRRSPVLRQILAYIQRNIINRQPGEIIKKLLITEDVPVLAWYYEVVLQFTGFNCRVLHSDLTNAQRQELVEDFNSASPDSCQILVQMYRVNAVGTNLHKNCSRVLIASQSHSLRMQSQAIHRVIRFGQKDVVQVSRLMVNNSFHAFQESRQVDKLLPELSARAQDKTNDDLVKLLNLMQDESYRAWGTPAAKKLMGTKKILSDNYLNALAQKDDEDQARLPANGWSRWGSTERQERAAFLSPRTRRQFYESYKELNKVEKLNFDHGKNGLRRLLMYSGPSGKRRPPYRTQDLSDRCILERALELQIRVQLGADSLAMLPIPQINLWSISQEDLEKLADELDEIKKLECDNDKSIQTVADTTSPASVGDGSLETDSGDGSDLGDGHSDSESESGCSSEESSEESDDEAPSRKRQRVSQVVGSSRVKLEANTGEPDLSLLVAYNAD